MLACLGILKIKCVLQYRCDLGKLIPLFLYLKKKIIKKLYFLKLYLKKNLIPSTFISISLNIPVYFLYFTS